MDHLNANGCVCGGRHVTGRACTPEAKRDAVERLLAAWERSPMERLGQFVVNAAGSNEAFVLEDAKMLDAMEARVRR